MNEQDDEVLVSSDTFLNMKVHQVFRKYTYQAIDRSELENSLSRLGIFPDIIEKAIKIKDIELGRLTKGE